ncbi:MAG: hypothetical protein HRT90_04860 [Candidatus Margulisbacteria bacterium]|nr:hypothetical protein [Candidatus Margulisiibacteriota bacterium]
MFDRFIFFKKQYKEDAKKQEYTLSKVKTLEIYQGVMFIVKAENEKLRKEFKSLINVE